jgi:hypothetical protein
VGYKNRCWKLSGGFRAWKGLEPFFFLHNLIIKVAIGLEKEEIGRVWTLECVDDRHCCFLSLRFAGFGWEGRPGREVRDSLFFR